MAGAMPLRAAVSWEQLPSRVEVLPDCEAVESALNVHDAELSDEDSTDHIDGSKIQKMINERYNKVTSLYLDETGFCTRYAYYTEGSGIPSYEAHNRILNTIIQDTPIKVLRLPVVETSFQSKWLQLNEKTKDKLYLILYAANSIWKRILYDVDQEKWVHRTSKHKPNDVHSTLVDYGLTRDKRSVLDILINGRLKESMKRSIQNIKDALMCSQRLDDVWVSALTTGMTNGTGQAAVYMLLDMISSLNSGFEKKYPAIAVTHGTSYSSNDAFSGTSFNSSKSTTQSSDDSPAPKRRRINYDVRRRLDVELDSHFEDEKDVDLRVVSLDVDSGTAKYIVVGEILSEGKTLLQASIKFTKELVHILQLQTLVFGLMFTQTNVLLYKARKDSKGRILISHEKYYLLESHRREEEGSGEDSKYEFFRVAQFQKLVMDIFTCIVYGMDCIDA